MAVGDEISRMTGGDGRAALRAALKKRLRAYLMQKRAQGNADTAGGMAGLLQLVAFLRQQQGANLPGAEMSPERRQATKLAALSRILRGVHGPYNLPVEPGTEQGTVYAGGEGFEVDEQPVYEEGMDPLLDLNKPLRPRSY